jgi:hypothetical protein
MAASLAADGIDSRWEPEVKRAKQGGRRLVDELTEEQVRERIGRERKALHEAAVYGPSASPG